MYLSALVSIEKKNNTKKERNEEKTTTTTKNGTRIRQPRGKGTKGGWAPDYRRETKKKFHSLKMKCYPSCFADRKGFFFLLPVSRPGMIGRSMFRRATQMIDCGFSKMPTPHDEHLNSRTQRNSKQLHSSSLSLSFYFESVPSDSSFPNASKEK